MSRFLLILVAICSCSFANAAVVRYSYQGQELQTGGSPGSVGQPPLGPEGLTEISGYLDFGQGLAPDLDSASATGILSYRFFDGVTVVDETNSYVQTLEVSTDASGNLTAWLLTLPQAVPGTEVDDPVSMRISSENLGDATFPEFDSVTYSGGQAHIGPDTVQVSVIIRSAGAGEWSAAVIPIPTTAWLFGSALGFLGWVRRKCA